MKILHLVILLFFTAILLFLGLKNANGSVAILNAGGTQISNNAKVLQGR